MIGNKSQDPARASTSGYVHMCKGWLKGSMQSLDLLNVLPWKDARLIFLPAIQRLSQSAKQLMALQIDLYSATQVDDEESSEEEQVMPSLQSY